MKKFLHKTSLLSVALASVVWAWTGSANAQATRAFAAVESHSAQSDSVFRTVGWRNGYGRGYGYYGRPYASYYGPGAYYAPRARYYAPYRGYGYGYGDYYSSRYGYGYPYGAARVGPVRVFWR